jgi:hypothetical protein
MRVSAWSVIVAGRLLALGVAVVAGTILTALDARELGGSGVIPHYQLRWFIGGALEYVWLGSTLLVLAEIAARFGPESQTARFDWNLTDLVRAMALLVLGGGIGLAVWGAMTRLPDNIDFFGNSPSPYFLSKRAAAHLALDYAWRAGFLLLAAEIADRLGWRYAGEEDPLEEPAAVEPSAQPAR